MLVLVLRRRYVCGLRALGKYGSQDTSLNSVVFPEPFLNSMCSVARFIIPMPFGNTIAMKGCTWSVTMFHSLVCVKLTPV